MWETQGRGFKIRAMVYFEKRARDRERGFDGGYEEERKKMAETKNADSGCILEEERKRGTETD